MKNLKGPAVRAGGWWKRRAIEISGWLLILAGLAALVLPGPGLLSLVAGLTLLSMRYMWARRLLRPVKARAFLLAAKGVKTRPRIVASVLGALALALVGIIWGVGTAVPTWWPLADRWWLAGGWGTGVTLISSGGFALSLIVYSFRKFRSQVPGNALPAVSD
ncbi:PGPGW domain-containing protein [Arthrobacter sp. E3]|uniref:PGPGW domain-containing protein n=1 Tax=Arthrobacter sp. E3 TaxID=517402 RepID=UPI001A947C1A